MEGLTVLVHLGWSILLWFMLQMLILTVVVRAITVLQHRLWWGDWHAPIALVMLSHVVALFGFAAMTDFVGPGAPASDGVAALLYSAAVLWPVQLLFLAVDLGLRVMRARQAASS